PLLEEQLWASRYLSGDDNDGGIPLFSKEELAKKLEAFSKFLRKDRDHLLATGLPSKRFKQSPWLEARLARLYPVHCTENSLPADDTPNQSRGKFSAYRWSRVVYDYSGDHLDVIKARVRRHDAEVLQG